MIANHKPVIHGINQILKELSYENIDLTTYQNMSNEDVIEIVKAKNIENQEMLKEISDITNPSVEDKLIFGKKDISSAIENYMIKKLFINPKIKDFKRKS